MIHSLHIACKQQTSFGSFFMLLLFQRDLIMHNLHITLTQQTLVSQQPRSSHPPNVLIIPTTAILYSKEKRQDSLPQLPDATGKCIITNMESLNAQKRITIGISKWCSNLQVVVTICKRVACNKNTRWENNALKSAFKTFRRGCFRLLCHYTNSLSRS